jgi:hypothetical protein
MDDAVAVGNALTRPEGAGDRPDNVKRDGRRNYHTTVQRAYLASTRALSLLLVLVGVAMVASTLARGGGVLALGVVLGTMFALVGAGRLWLARDGRR